MAVQAQYPSNVLLLNRNGQGPKGMGGEDGFFALAMQTDAGLADQSRVIFGNGGACNARKRGRETAAPPSMAPINLFSVQSPAPALVNISQLHNQQPAMVSTGLGLSIEDQKQQQSSMVVASLLSEDVASQIKQHKLEIDQFLLAQSEQLRLALAERRQRHQRELLRAAEAAALRRLREKEAEVETAVRRHSELEARVAQLRAEADGWRSKARAQEVVAASLQTQLQQAVLCAAENREASPGAAAAEDAESAFEDPDRVVAVGPPCRACRRGTVSVVLLPCRHLCVCTDCDARIAACPLCHSARSAAVEVFFS